MTTHENIDETWPTTNNGDNIRWEIVKTEEEEYLDKLQTKLKNVMSHTVHSNSRNNIKNTGSSNKGGPNHSIEVEPDDLEDNGNSSNLLPIDDEGLHLLYNQDSNHDYHVVTSEEIISEINTTEQSTALPHPDQSSNTLFPPDDNAQQQQDVDVDVSDIAPGLVRPRMVRFRSRVRIGSGIRNISSSSSTCGSVSSSISVPLRESGSLASRPNLTGHTTASLTEMLTTDATNAWLQGLSTVRRAKRQPRNETGLNQNTNRSPTERTALLARVYSYAEPTENDLDNELDRIQAAARKTEEEVVFGKWPWRLFNRYWWWWRIEWIICCCERFDDESDSDN
ncbi:hypothetical protein Clacol_008127 [Clathrus columnatus]|uniref:Uncharacterized protein n=1 Tax=Clathrus columnatus TaxID=1419009 RepID=A0AAV5APN9_9AGAM|nr:hypothetical protein Clacol_008127 [Clathrus columnatus]